MENDNELIRKGYILPSKEFIKTEEQIEGIRKSGVLTKKILDIVEDKIKEGITTNQINEWVHDYTIQNGGYPGPLNYNGYPKSICTSLNNVICHGIPDDTVLKSGDIINVDVTTALDGYYSDSSRTFKIGQVSTAAAKLVGCAKTCLELGINAVKPYKSISDIGRAIEPYAKGLGYSIVRDFGGHGVGIALHEEPFICHFTPNRDEMIMLPGMVFTVEPMINQGSRNIKLLPNDWTAVTKDGSLSAQWEHTVLVTKDGFEILT
jgi:methionyl aminopeptidase